MRTTINRKMLAPALFVLLAIASGSWAQVALEAASVALDGTAPTTNVAIQQASSNGNAPWRYQRPAGTDRNPRHAGQTFQVGPGGLVLDKITVRIDALASAGYDGAGFTLGLYDFSNTSDVVPAPDKDSPIFTQTGFLPATLKSDFDAGADYLTIDLTDQTLTAGQYGFLLMLDAQSGDPGDNMLLAIQTDEAAYADGIAMRRHNRGADSDAFSAQEFWTGSTDADLDMEFYLQEGHSMLANAPSPGNGADDVLHDADLDWSPGIYAVKHNVYLGRSFDDVNTASAEVLVGDGLDANSLDVDPLAFGQTYYWRVDEGNAAPDNTTFEGDVWSFTVEPVAIPVEMIMATASSSNADNMGPQNTINGIGLNELDQHSTEPTDMWLSGLGDPTPWIQYAFDKAYKLHEMWVWNSNQLVESFVGIGAKDAVIETSLDGAEWTILEDAAQFAQATGAADYVANTIVDLGGVLAQHVKITINAGYGTLPQYGLSAARFLYIPTFAREAQPADSAVDVPVDAVLNWRAGREAAVHEVYLGADPADLALVGTTDDNRYDAAALNYDSTYYWQIVVVNEAETPAAYAGPVSSFTTPAYGIVDNFDQYNDNCNRIFFAWKDGLGHNGAEEVANCDVAPSNGNGGGSIVGNAMAPFAEQTVVNAGSRQSMPFEYDNALGASEATLTLDGQDWTASGIKILSIMFYGDPDNSGQLYVKINNSKVPYSGDAADITRPQWQAWVIDLAQVNSNLQNVTSLTIGVDGASASGMILIDDIRLYPNLYELTYLTITNPSAATGDIAGWTGESAGAHTAGVSDGDGNGFWVFTGPLTQTLTDTFMPGTYTLSVDVIYRNSGSAYDFGLYYENAGSLVSVGTTSGSKSSSPHFETFDAVVTVNSGDPALGRPIVVVLSRAGGTSSWYDNVRLGFVTGTDN